MSAGCAARLHSSFLNNHAHSLLQMNKISPSPTISIPEITNRKNDAAFLLDIVQKFIKDPDFVPHDVAGLAVNQLWKSKSSLKGDPLALHQLQLRVLCQIGVYTKAGKDLCADLLKRLPTSSQARQSTTYRNALAVLHIRVRLYSLVADLSIEELEELYKDSESWIEILSRSDHASAEKLSFSLHGSLWKIASTIDGDDCQRWYSLSLMALLLVDSGQRFYSYAFRVRDTVLLDVNVEVMDMITVKRHNGSSSSHHKDVLVRWAYRLGHTAYLSKNAVLKSKLLSFISDLSLDHDEMFLLRWWQSFTDGRLILESFHNTVRAGLIHEVFKRCADWCSSQMEKGRRDTKCVATLIPLAHDDYNKAVFFSSVFECAGVAVNNLDHIIRAVQCRFSPTADHDRVLKLLGDANRSLGENPHLNPASVAVLWSSVFNSCAILFNTGNHDTICLKYLKTASECFSNYFRDQKRTELWAKILEMYCVSLLRQGASDTLRFFAYPIQNCRSQDLKMIIKTFVSCNLKFYKGPAICSADLSVCHNDRERLLSLLNAEYGCYDKMDPSVRSVQAKIRILQAISNLELGAHSELILALYLRKDRQFEIALAHAQKALLLVGADSVESAPNHVLLAALLHDCGSKHPITESYKHLDRAIKFWYQDKSESVMETTLDLMKRCSELLRILFQNLARFVELKHFKSDSTEMLMLALTLESKFDRRGHVPLLQTCMLVLEYWTEESEFEIDIDDVDFLLDVLSGIGLEQTCPGSISSLAPPAYPLTRIIVLQNASNATVLRSLKFGCSSVNFPRLCYAISIVEYEAGDLTASLTWAAQAVHYQFALKAPSTFTYYYLKIFLYHIAKLSEMTGNHSQAFYYYHQSLNISKVQNSALYEVISLCGLAHVQNKRRNTEETEKLISEIHLLWLNSNFGFSSVSALSLMIEGDFRADPEYYRRALKENPGVRTRARLLRRTLLFDKKRRSMALKNVQQLLPQLKAMEKARTYLVLATDAMKTLDSSPLFGRSYYMLGDAFDYIREYLKQAWINSDKAPIPDFRRRLMLLFAEVYGFTYSSLVAWALNAALGVSSCTEVILERSLFNGSFDDTIDLFSSLSLSSDVDALTEQLNQKLHLMPFEWTIVTMVTSKTHLFLCNLSRDERPLIARIPRDALDEIVLEFDSIMEQNKQSVRAGAETSAQKRKWWSERHQLDRRLSKVLDDLENRLLGFYKGLLCVHTQKRKLFDKKAHKIKSEHDRTFFEIFLGGFPFLAKPQREFGCDLLDISEFEANEMFDVFKDDSDICSSPIILILDEVLQRLPWENLICLKDRPIYRLPSIEMLVMRMKPQQLDPGLSFYILNPGNDLPQTQARLESEFKNRSGWKGIIGVSPTKMEYHEALAAYDLFIYCGHSSGEQYFGHQDLRKMNVRSVSLLLGCSSGMLRAPGSYEPRGTCLAYLQAGCPAILGNLWDVTDCDIDRFSQALFNNWIDGNLTPDLSTAIARSRCACKLSLLNGAAPVCYGVPVYSRHSEPPAATIRHAIRDLHRTPRKMR